MDKIKIVTIIAALLKKKKKTIHKKSNMIYFKCLRDDAVTDFGHRGEICKSQHCWNDTMSQNGDDVFL